MLIGLSLPIMAVFLREPWVRVSYIDFVLHATPVTALTMTLIAFLRQQGWLRPIDSPVFSWEAALFQIIRWPWAVYGSLMGIVMAIRKQNVVFRVTPKGAKPALSMRWTILSPYVAIVLLSFLPALFVKDAGEARGYYFFLILAQIVYVLAMFAIVLIHRHEGAKQNG